MPRRKSYSATQLVQSGSKRQKVAAPVNDRKTGRPIVMKPHHAVAHDGKQQYVTEIMAPAASTTALNNTGTFSFILENDAAGLIEDGVLRFNITMGSAAGKVMPVPLWFDRIEWYDRHTGQEIARYHGDAMWLMYQTLPKDTRELWSEGMGCIVEGNGLTDKEQQQNEIKNYYLPLPHVWFEGFELDLSQLEGDIEIKFYPKGSILQDNDASGAAQSTAVPTVNEIRMISASQKHSEMGRLNFRREKALSVHQHNYLDVQRYTDSGRVLAASTAYTIDLDQFHHESAFLAVMLRADTDGDGLVKYATLGPKGTIDHENVHGRSLLGDGTPIDEDYFRKYVCTQLLPADFVKNNPVYIIPFSNSLSDVFSGAADGFHAFRGDRERLRIVTDGAGTDCSYAVTYNADAGGGTIRYHYKGCSTEDLATTSTYAQAAAAINAMPSVQEDGFQVSIANDNTGTTIATGAGANFQNWTLTKFDGSPYVRGTRGIIEIDFTETTTTASATRGTFVEGVPGFEAATYTIEVYSFYYRHVQQAGGRIRAEDL